MSIRRQRGMTLVELLVTTAISLLIFAGLSGVVRTTLNSKSSLETRTELMRQASFALDRMVRVVSHSRVLMVPQADKPASNWRENVREQTIPASPPEGSSFFATAVLAVTLPAYSDLDFDGVPDADNDRDGRIDEDPPDDINNDFAPGVAGIDDGGNGLVDDGLFADWDDDEAFSQSNEDPLNGIDDDADNNIDEDPAADANGDGCSGICGIDDDGDGAIDEDATGDDDEDGTADEDWYDAVAFYLDNDTLIERTPVPWDESGVGGITGLDFVTSEIADQVTLLRFERAAGANGSTLVDITLELTGTDGVPLSLNTRVRLGGAL